MAPYFSCIELRGEQAAVHFRREAGAGMADQATQCDRGIHLNGGQQLAREKIRALDFCVDVQRIDPSGNEMHECIADALLRQDRVCFGARYHFLTLGTTELEVIAPIGDEPSPYREFLAAGGLGMHHLAFVVPSIDEHLAARSGLDVVLDARLQPDGRFVYVEGLLAGVLVELIQMPSLPPAP